MDSFLREPLSPLLTSYLTKVELGLQSILCGLIFMLCCMTETDKPQKVQLPSYSECFLSTQKTIDVAIHIRYHVPPGSSAPSGQPEVLDIGSNWWQQGDEPDLCAFSACSPLLNATAASFANDREGEFDDDFRSELAVQGSETAVPVLTLANK